ncbi:MAG: hypothetical protein RXQ56_10735 [Thermoproteus sp.]|jgi:hypothetical protein|nr:hypothetical protein [Thermoproteus sp.]MDT7882545.1 hypothetical protein [Thermoproteus sp.]
MTYLLGLDAVRIATKRTIGLLREAPRLKRLLETGRVDISSGSLLGSTEAAS